jgi:hypothetical protein
MVLVGQLGPGLPELRTAANSSITCFTSGPNGALSVASLIRVWRGDGRSDRERPARGAGRDPPAPEVPPIGARAEGRRRRRLARRYNLVAGRRRAKIILTGIEPSGAG